MGDALVRRRERCKVNQKRYRASRIALNQRLISDVHVLERQVQLLTLSLNQRQRWGAQESAVAENFRVLASGYDKSERHDAHFRHLYSPNLRFNDHNDGLQLLVQTWATYTDTFASMQLECLRIDVPCRDDAANDEGREACVVEAWVAAHLRVDWKAVDVVFPHLRQDLVVRLVGSVLVLPMRLSFVFDDQVRVVRHTSEANMVQALYDHFGNLHDVSAAMAKSRITPTAEILPT